MARGKKKEELTLEEKLERALVLVEEQPYEVPENWCFFRFTSLIDIEGGTQPPKSQFVEEPMDGYVRLVQIRDFASDKYVVYVPDTKKLRKFNKDDVMIARYGASIGRICTGLEGAYNVALAKTIFSREVLNRDYVYWMLQSETFQYPLRTISRSAQAGFNKKDLSNFLLPLPPIAEQQRIVDRVESLFTKLDEAKEKVQEVIDQYELRTSSILHKAFVGDLSLKWRTMHGKTKENWDVKRIKDVCKPRAGYAFNSKKFQNHGCQIIRMGNLYGGVLDLSRSPVFICEDELDEKIINRAKIKNGDILITLTGTKYKRDYGYAVCIENPENLYVNQRILCLTPNANINRDYLLYYLRSNIFRDIFFSNETGGVNQGNVSSKFVENIEIQVPPIEEQIAIITVMNNILLKEERAKKFAECVLQRIDLMKKSILTKAFRGELGTNNPEEESAIKLLKKILVET